jgi:two-component system, OmpR family, response regulator MprA
MNSISEDTINNNSNSILVISEDIDCMDILKKGLINKYEISYFNNNKFHLLNEEINNYNLIIFDNSTKELKKFIEDLKLAKSYNFNIPMLLLEDGNYEETSVYKYCNVYTIFDKKIDENFLFLNIDIALGFLYSNKKVQFENGFYFDTISETLYQGKKIIKLTKIEKKLVNLLASNPNTLVTYEDISATVWKGKEFSIYSLRNVIKHIREKTEEAFIKNSSNRGYIINTL